MPVDSPDDTIRKQEESRKDRPAAIHRWTMRILHGTLAVGFVLAVIERQWLNALSIAAILAVTFLPSIAFRHLRVYIPPEFELLALVFVYAALFLGEIMNYYQRFWCGTSRFMPVPACCWESSDSF